ncbi:MAG: Holliday junction branch migration protein RuvA [Candidatus Dojkabacteria bacterium]
MITYITGEVFQNNVDSIDILLTSGLAYRVKVPATIKTSLRINIGEKIALYTSFQVREESQNLYGFATQKERDLFETLLSVSGIGPKTAISILSTYSLIELNQLLEESDAKMLSKAPGLGLKGAQKIILELRGKLALEDEATSQGGNSLIEQLQEALTSLGFTGKELKKMLEKANSKSEKANSVEELIQYVLKEN